MQENELKSQPNVYQRVLSIMEDLDYIQKGEKTVNNTYRFVSHDQVTAAIHPLCVKHRLLPIPSTISSKQDGNMTQLMLRVKFVNVDQPEDFFEVDFPGYGIDGGGVNREGKPIPVGDKGPGKAVSYAYKYSILKTFCLETGEDPDNNANAAYEPAKCLDFDLTIGLHIKEAKKLEKFLIECSESTRRHIEDVKREAVARPEQFMEAFKKWSKK